MDAQSGTFNVISEGESATFHTNTLPTTTPLSDPAIGFSPTTSLTSTHVSIKTDLPQATRISPATLVPVITIRRSTLTTACVAAATIILIITITLTIIFVKRRRKSRNVVVEGTHSTIFGVETPWVSRINVEGPHLQLWYSRTVNPLAVPARDQQPLFGRSAKKQAKAGVMRRKKISERIRSTQREMEQISLHESNTVAAQMGGGQSAEMEQQVVSLQEQMQQMRGQMEHLQRQLHSDWAMGLTDDDPPAYVRIPGTQDVYP